MIGSNKGNTRSFFIPRMLRRQTPMRMALRLLAGVGFLALAGCGQTSAPNRTALMQKELCPGIGPSTRRVVKAYETNRYNAISVEQADDAHTRYANCTNLLTKGNPRNFARNAHAIGYAFVRVFQSEYVYAMAVKASGDVTTAREDFEHIVDSLSHSPHCYTGSSVTAEACPEYEAQFDEIIGRANAQLARM